MKNLLLLSLITIFTFSCTEYNDDGLPNSNVEPIFNPDGTKKLKRVINDLIITQQMNSADTPEPMSTITETHTETNYNRNNYGFTTIATTTIAVSGLSGFGDMGDEQPDMNTNSTMTTTTDIDGDFLRELRVENNVEGTRSTTRNVFSYDAGRISSITVFENNEQISTANFTFNDDNIVIERTYTGDEHGAETINLSIVDSLISSISIANTYTDNIINIDLVRDSVNLVQANISRSSESLTSTYAYDDAHYYKHNLGSLTNLEDRIIAEAITLNQIPAVTTEDQELSLINIDAGLRGLVDMATHNFTRRLLDGETVETNSYTYDEDNYPITISIDVDADIMMDTTNQMDDFADAMLANLLASGLSEEEAQAQLEELLDMFNDMDTSTELSNFGTIEYFD